MKKVFIYLSLFVFASCNSDEPDSIAPEILSFSPSDLETRIPIDAIITVNFSEPIDTTTLKDNFKLMFDGNIIPTGLETNNDTFITTMSPLNNLGFGESYEVRIGNGLKDLGGNMVMDTSWIFSTIDSAIVKYTVTFHATWSEESHPDDFPSNPHFSGLIGMTHNEDASLYEVGQLASLGIKDMAERGQKGNLTTEINQFIMSGDGFSIIDGGGVSLSPGSVSTEFTISIDHTMATVTTMIAPSPDWFLAVSVQLMEDDLWIDSLEVNATAYDAGTDSGLTFTSANLITDPFENTFVITDPPLGVDGSVAPMGSFKFIRKE